MRTRFCNICHEKKPISEFHADRRNKYGIRYDCKDCRNAIRASRYEVGSADFEGYRRRVAAKKETFMLMKAWTR
jgi:nitrate/TMAO reductase-like tetraheme cytochrome c subunit